MDMQFSTDEAIWENIQRANGMAAHILRYHTGEFTNEDVVAHFLSGKVRQGRSREEIAEILSGPKPKLNRYLTNSKNDIIRGEKAKKRGNGIPITSLDEIESFWPPLGNDVVVNPEDHLQEKEAAMHTKSVLDKLLEGSQLSDTQHNIINLTRQGCPVEEIAKVLGISIDSVYARRTEAMKKLAQKARQMKFHITRSTK